MVSNSFLPLFITTDIKDSPDNGDDIISFGKYRGYHLHDIYTIDPRYVVWIADKYEPHVKSEMRFKELAVTYSKIYLDLQTRKKYKMPVSRFVGTPGEKLSDLKVNNHKSPHRRRFLQDTDYPWYRIFLCRSIAHGRGHRRKLFLIEDKSERS